jgi:hypothetical protein
MLTVTPPLSVFLLDRVGTIVYIYDMKKMTVKDFDPAEYIQTKEDVLANLKVTLEENDPEFLLSVIGDIARSKGMVQNGGALSARTG